MISNEGLQPPASKRRRLDPESEPSAWTDLVIEATEDRNTLETAQVIFQPFQQEYFTKTTQSIVFIHIFYKHLTNGPRESTPSRHRHFSRPALRRRPFEPARIELKELLN